MKTNFLKFAPIAAVALACGSSAMAYDGILTVHGQVRASPCYIDNIDSSATPTMVSVSQYGTAINGATAGVPLLADVTVPDVQDTIAVGGVGATTTVGLHVAGGNNCANGTYRMRLSSPISGQYATDPTIAVNEINNSNLAAQGVGIQVLAGSSASATAIDLSNTANLGELIGTVGSAATATAMTYQFRLARPTNTPTTVLPGLVQTQFMVTISN